MMFSRLSITTKLLLLFLLVGIASVLIVGTYSFYSARQAIIRRTLDQLISVRAVKNQQMGYFYNEKIKNLENLCRNERVTNLLTGGGNNQKGQEFIRNLDLLRNNYKAYGFINLYIIPFLPARASWEKSKMIIADTTVPGHHTDELTSRIEEICQKGISADTVLITDLFFRSSNDTLPCCLISHRVLSSGGDVIGTVILEISSLDINRIMLQDNRQIGLGNSGESYIVGGDLLMRSTSRFIERSVLSVPVNSESVKSGLEGKSGTVVTNDYRGIRVFSAYEPLGVRGLHWVVLAEIDWEEAMIPVIALRNDILMVSLVISVLILGFAQVISKMITQPIMKLKKAAISLGEGNFDHQVRITSGDEIGMLAETFNHMADQIKDEREKRLLALFDGQEMERRRISRELHDGMGQKLVGAKLQLENCNDNDLECLRKTVGETKDCLHAIIEELRGISNDLMPVALDELGLETALQNLCNDVERQSGIEAEFGADLPEVVTGKIAIYLFRIAQEGLQNIIKHSKAGRFSLQLIDNRESLILIVEDNGIGFEPARSENGNGLSNMKERASLLGGTFSLETASGEGTTLRIKIPIRNDQSN